MSRFSLRKRILSFRYAFRGIGQLIKHEHNFWIHMFAALTVVILGSYFNVSRDEWLALIVAIALVLIAEGINTAIEYLANAITNEENEKIRWAKDIAAGSVLIAAFMAMIIGLIVFIPYLI